MISPPQLLAAFVSPALATAGAAAVAAPILIHLLARRRFKRIRWAAMDFLIDAERRNRRRVRLEELILLALRCLAVLFVGLMVARPFLSAGGIAAAWGGSRRTERVFLLDDSFSMGYESADGTSFSRAKTALRRLVEAFRRDTPDDAVTILRMSAPTSPVVAGAYLDAEQTEATLARVEALAPSQRSIELADVFKGLAEVLARDPGTVNAAVYVLSDFQRRDWTPQETQGTQPATDSGAPGLTAPLSVWAGKDRGLRILLINVGQEDAPNLAVVGLDFQGSRPVAGAAATVRATVANFARRSAENLQLTVQAGHQPSRRAGTKSIPSLAEFQQVSVDAEAEFLGAGDESVRAEISRDALPIDNVRYAAVDVVSAVRVLLVNGRPSADEYEDEVALLRTALRPEGEIFSGQEVVVVDEAGLETANLAAYHAVILANVYRVSAPAVETLERFVRGGGGLMVFLGDQVDAPSYNAELFRGGEGILPAELGEVVRPNEPSHLVIADRLHPALRAMGGADDPLGIAQIPFFEYYSCALPAGDSPEDATSDRASSGPAITSSSARVVARFSDAEEHPAIVERAVGAGRVLLIATSADKKWNSWPDHPTYLPVMTELLRHIARRGGGDLDRWVGSHIDLPLDPAQFETDVIVRGPGYPNEPEATATAVPAEDGGGLQIRWEHTDSAGIYQFAMRGRNGGETIRLAAVNVDPTESDLTMVRDEVLGRTMGGVPFEYVRGLDQLASAAGEAKTELWTPLLLAAMAALMTEQTLAWWWGRRR